eukprot:9876955-Alexandrium_andersonii.AAC.1
MSASLVGSEMCIRDSIIDVDSFGTLAENGSGVPRGPSRRTVAGPRRGPVSYTHLTLPTICSV